MRSGHVNAFMKVFNDLFNILKNGSLTGYFSLPHKAKCSKICGIPLSFDGKVFSITPKTLLVSLDAKWWYVNCNSLCLKVFNSILKSGKEFLATYVKAGWEYPYFKI